MCTPNVETALPFPAACHENESPTFPHRVDDIESTTEVDCYKAQTAAEDDHRGVGLRLGVAAGSEGQWAYLPR